MFFLGASASFLSMSSPAERDMKEGRKGVGWLVAYLKILLSEIFLRSQVNALFIITLFNPWMCLCGLVPMFQMAFTYAFISHLGNNYFIFLPRNILKPISLSPSSHLTPVPASPLPFTLDFLGFIILPSLEHMRGAEFIKSVALHFFKSLNIKMI